MDTFSEILNFFIAIEDLYLNKEQGLWQVYFRHINDLIKCLINLKC